MSKTYIYRREPLEDSFNDAVKQMRPALLCRVPRRYRFMHDAEDILQDAIAEHWKYVSRYEMPQTYEEFFKHAKLILRWKILDASKARFLGTNGSKIFSLDDPDYPVNAFYLSTEFDPSARLCDAEISEFLNKLFGTVSEINPRLGKVLRLRFLEHRSTKDISDLLSVPLSNISMWINRFRKKYGSLCEDFLLNDKSE